MSTLVIPATAPVATSAQPHLLPTLFRASATEATVKAHVSAILQKLGVDSRTQAVIAAAKIETGQWPAGAAH